MSMQTYRGYHIHYDPPPIGVRSCDWQFYHDDFDGADGGDGRCGCGPSEADCRAQIDDIEDDRALADEFEARS